MFNAMTSARSSPERKLFWSSRFVRLTKLPISDGSGPSRTLVPRRMLLKLVTCPMVVGIAETKKLLSRSSVSAYYIGKRKIR